MNTHNTFIYKVLREYKYLSATEIAQKTNASLRTTQRNLQNLLELGQITKSGHSKNTVYSLSSFGIVTYQPDIEYDLAESRLEKDPVSFNFEIFNWLKQFDFTQEEHRLLNNATNNYQFKLKQASKLIEKREFERLIVEFSWKSSSIEGDTYTLLDTEKLLLEGIPNRIKTQEEAQIILNHKTTLDFIFQNPDYFQSLNTKKILEIHKLLTYKLGVKNEFRKSGVGITGSLFRPLDNQHQIQEAVEKMVELINKTDSNYLKSLYSSLLIAYIQPFEDGNKRTSRLLANAVLFSHKQPLLSYRNTKVENYRNAILAFYELNSIYLFKQIFIDQIEYFSQYYF